MCKEEDKREGVGGLGGGQVMQGLGGHFLEASVSSSGQQRPDCTHHDEGSRLPSYFQTMIGPGSSTSRLLSASPAFSSWSSLCPVISASSGES